MKDATAQTYVALRAQGTKAIYHVELEGLDFLFRPLSFSEYQLVLDLEKRLTGPVINDTIVRIAVLHCELGSLEEWLDKCQPSSPDQLAQVIVNESGFQDKERFLQVLARERKAANEFQSVIQMYISMAFSMKPSEIDDLNMEEQMRLFAMAEQMLGQPVDVNNLFQRPQEEMPTAEPTMAPPHIPVPEGMTSIDLEDPVMSMPEFQFDD